MNQMKICKNMKFIYKIIRNIQKKINNNKNKKK